MKVLAMLIASGGGMVLAQSMPIPDWLQALREVGSFGLVAFIVWWWATHVSPESEKRFLEALNQQRVDYIKATETQRGDYLAAQANLVDRLDRHSNVIEQLTSVTAEHVGEARAVWIARGEIPSRKP